MRKKAKLFFLTKNTAGKKKLVQQRKLYHDKTIKSDFSVLLFKNGTIGHKFFTYGKSLVQKSENFMTSGTILKVVEKSPIYIFAMK